MLWQRHNGFDTELKRLAKKIHNLDNGLTKAKKLLEKQFHPSDPVQVIAPAKIHHIQTKDLRILWKLEMQVENLRPSQFPRVWFVISGDTITFLAIRSHIQNYDDNEINRLALDRFSEIA